MKTVAFFTLGCKVNQCDTEKLEQLFRDNGYAVVDFDQKADVYVINTCTVTAVSDKKSRQMLSHARRSNPDAIICATGCYAQRAKNELSNLPAVDIVAGMEYRDQIIEKINDFLKLKNGISTDIPCNGHPESDKTNTSQGRTRAFLKIQEGCNHFCSYCIVPHVRGRERSQPVEDLLTRANAAAAKGCREVVLTGIQLSSYGRDLGYGDGLAILAERLSEIIGIARIRFGSLEMDVLSETFIKRMADQPKVCRHYHIPLQSGSDTVLRRMNRHYTTAEYAARIESLRSIIPEVAVTTDIMAGFPGENDEEFLSSLNFAEQMRFNKMHVFPYSRREGTPAAVMPGQIPNRIKAERAARLNALGQRVETEYLKALAGSVQQVLVEESFPNGINGHTDRYVFVKATGSRPVNSLAGVHITGVEYPAVTGAISRSECIQPFLSMTDVL